jgi:hypothetical protein
MTLALAGCASPAAESKAGEPPASGTPQAQIANPWSDAASAGEAAEGAGLDSLVLPTVLELREMEFANPSFSCMEGIAQANYEAGAAALVVRKGAADTAVEELSGDYSEYERAWVQDCNGIEVQCFGNVEGEAIRIGWQTAMGTYSVMMQGLGGDEIGLTAGDVVTVVESIR